MITAGVGCPYKLLITSYLWECHRAAPDHPQGEVDTLHFGVLPRCTPYIVKFRPDGFTKRDWNQLSLFIRNRGERRTWWRFSLPEVQRRLCRCKKSNEMRTNSPGRVEIGRLWMQESLSRCGERALSRNKTTKPFVLQFMRMRRLFVLISAPFP